MDLIAHAVFGAAVGGSWVSAVVAVLPDASLLTVRRVSRPTPAYFYAHSLWPILLLSWYPDAALGWASHVVLDWLTHGDLFSPRWVYPIKFKWLTWPNTVIIGSEAHWAPFQEWEFCNRSWWVGIGVVACTVAYRMAVR